MRGCPMPMLNETTIIITKKCSPDTIGQTSDEAHLFEMLPLPAQFVYPDSRLRREKLQAYLDGLPLGIQEGIRAALYHALTSNPPRPLTFTWVGAYDYKLEHVETFDTYNSPRTAGIIGLTLHGRYPDDAHPLADQIHQSGSRKPSTKREAKASPQPAKRRPSKRS